MKIKRVDKSPTTISEVCGEAPGSFQKHIDERNRRMILPEDYKAIMGRGPGFKSGPSGIDLKPTEREAAKLQELSDWHESSEKSNIVLGQPLDE